MSEQSRQNTDQLPIDTSKYTYREVYRGSFFIQTTATAAGYSGTAGIDLSFLNTFLFMPEIEIWEDDSGGGTTAFSKLPFARVNTATGAISRVAYYSIQQNVPKGGGFSLAIACTLFDSSSAIAKTFYFKVLSSEAGPGTATDHSWPISSS